MSLRPEFFRYLDHFGKTCSLAELHRHPENKNAIGLRHDIDHDLDLALEVAHHEHERGLRATYFLLHSHPYWDDPDLLIKCRQLEAYGHEVGIHINVLTEWFMKECDDHAERVHSVIQQLRDGSITIKGVSAHGDRACYEYGFANYWIWQELRGARFGDHVSVEQTSKHNPERPDVVQHLASAEGVPVENESRQVPYPSDHVLHRDDGQSLPLWSLSLRAFGLQYDACYAGFDHYWTDTGGKWIRSSDPLSADLSRGRHQVLMHPVWWRGPQKQFFVLSAARSGSKWLANFIEKATSCRGFHELTLNIERRNSTFVEDKRTNDAYLDLLEDPGLARKRLREAITYLSQQPGDVLDANVYLEPLLPELQSIAPDARIVHLHRDGRDVVRSVISRGWYDAPEDRRHYVPPIPEWDQMTQFERACWYYRHTNESIMPPATARIEFERMVRDLSYLTDQLASLGILVHPLLAEREFPKHINPDRGRLFPPADEWPDEYLDIFHRVCGPLQQMLGYTDVSPAENREETPPPRRQAVNHPMNLAHYDFNADAPPAISADHVSAEIVLNGLSVRTTKTDASSAYVLLTRGRWANVSRKDGLACRPNCYYRGRVEYEMDDRMVVRVFVLYFDQHDNQIRAHQARRLRGDSNQAFFTFSPALNSSHFALAIHLGNCSPDEQMVLKRLSLQAVSLDPRYRSIENTPGLSPARQPARS